MVGSARRTPPLMGWVRAMYPVFDSIAMVRFGLQQEGGLSRIKNGRITTLTTSNGLPCDTIHWTTEDDDRSLWLYAACGLVRITRRELDAWVADPKRRIETTVWNEADGVMLQRAAPSSFGPTYAKAADGRLWYVTREGVQIVDPHHLASNKLPPPVHIEKVVADHKTYWQNLPGSAAVSNLRLPPRTRDLRDRLYRSQPHRARPGAFQIQTGGPRSGLERGHKRPPGAVFQSSSGALPISRDCVQQQRSVERGWRLLEFSVAPAYYQTNWFRALCAVLVLGSCGQSTRSGSGNCTTTSP